ncbi:MAG TPA: hypothetical protein VKM35_06165 [Arenimonas sp.]|nr:hypothetical protein [Arenimonas sp.]
MLFRLAGTGDSLMKRTTITFLAALALFLGTIASSKYSVSNDFIQKPLDFSGIDTVQFESAGLSEIAISKTRAPMLRHRPDDAAKIQVTRQGNTLLIRSDTSQYGDVELIIPATIRTLITQSARVGSKDKLDSLDIRASEDLYWSGDIKTLRITDTRAYGGCSPRCQNGLHVEDGAIADLTIATPAGEVTLNQADDINNATLLLGPDASFSLLNAHHVDRIRVVDFESGK